MNQRSAIACAVVAAASASSFALEMKDLPLGEQYKTWREVSLYACSLAYQIERTRGPGYVAAASAPPSKVPETLQACITQQTAQVDTTYRALQKSLRTSAARDALKTCQSTFIAALEGIRAGEEEVKLTYSARQAQLRDTTRAACARFDLEK